MAWTWSSRCKATSWPADGTGRRGLGASTCRRLVASRRVHKGAAIANLTAVAAMMLGSYHPPGEAAEFAAMAPSGDMGPWAAMLVTSAMASLLLYSASQERLQQGVAARTAAQTADDANAPAAEPHGENDRDEPVAGLMASMGHDLRTPLNAIIGFSDIMQQELHGPLGSERYQSYAGHIRDSGVSLLQAIERTLAVTEQLAIEDRAGKPGRSPGPRA